MVVQYEEDDKITVTSNMLNYMNIQFIKLYDDEGMYILKSDFYKDNNIVSTKINSSNDEDMNKLDSITGIVYANDGTITQTLVTEEEIHGVITKNHKKYATYKVDYNGIYITINNITKNINELIFDNRFLELFKED